MCLREYFLDIYYGLVGGVSVFNLKYEDYEGYKVEEMFIYEILRNRRGRRVYTVFDIYV